jgi:hypothetical protein
MEEARKASKQGAYNRRKEILATPPPPTGPPSAAPGTGRVQLVDNMQELAQLGGTGNKIMAYATQRCRSGHCLCVLSLVVLTFATSTTQWPDLNEIRKEVC